jgi:hypothetical protein
VNCAAQGGTSQGSGTNCAATLCSDSAAACCFQNTSCQNLTVEACTAAGGSWRGLGSICATIQCCETTFTTAQSTFQAAFPGLALEDFEDTLVSSNSVAFCAEPLNSTTNDACFPLGGSVGGLTLQTVEGTCSGTDCLIVLGSGFTPVGNPTAVVGPGEFGDTLAMVFAGSDVRAVSFDLLFQGAGLGAMDISVFGPGNVLIASTTATAAVPGMFFGVSSDKPIAKITVSSPTGTRELVDNIRFGAIPDADGDTIPDNFNCPGPCTGGNATNCDDNCPNTSNADQADDDGDGVGNACDPCPNDSPDDSDGDGVCDSADVCSGFDDNADADGDSTPDGCDGCPMDAGKTSPGECGCGLPDIDADGNGFLDCFQIPPDGLQFCPFLSQLFGTPIFCFIFCPLTMLGTMVGLVGMRVGLRRRWRRTKRNR